MDFFAALTVALSLFGLLPSKSQDVAALLPCQTLLVSQRNGTVCIAAEEGLMGTGRDWDAALQALHDTAPGRAVFGDGQHGGICRFCRRAHSHCDGGAGAASGGPCLRHG